MLKVCFALAALVLVAACQPATTGQNNGSGSLVLGSRAAAEINRVSRDEKDEHFQVHISADRQGRSFHWFSCPAPRPRNCAPPDDDQFFKSYEELSLHYCDPEGKLDCAIYSVYGEVVWNGPVFALSVNNRLKQPFNGRWPLEIRHSGAAPVKATLVGQDGDLSVENLRAGMTCNAVFDIRKVRFGDLKIDCPDNTSYRMTFQVKRKSVVRGRGKDSTGERVGFVLDLDAGQARLGLRR